MIGKVFKSWTVVSQVESNRRGRQFRCRCKCGKTRLLNAYQLNHPTHHKSCFGCYHKDRSRKSYSYLIGCRRGKWRILENIGIRDGKTYLSCRCECGKICEVSASKIKGNFSKQCEVCHLKECGFKKTHGLREIPEYHVWCGMRQRCLSKTNKKYKSYGGRGIKICDRWLKFENFVYDMGRRPGKRYILDRTDVDGDYCPDNCKWVSSAESANNRRCSKKYSDKYISGTFPKSLFCEYCLKKILKYR
jgi:hypothetical protein